MARTLTTSGRSFPAATGVGVTCHLHTRCEAASDPRSPPSTLRAPLIARPHADVHAKRDRLWDTQGSVDTPPWSRMTKHHHPGFMEEQPTDEVVAHAPERRQCLHGEMPLERGLGDGRTHGQPVQSKRRDNTRGEGKRTSGTSGSARARTDRDGQSCAFCEEMGGNGGCCEATYRHPAVVLNDDRARRSAK